MIKTRTDKAGKTVLYVQLCFRNRQTNARERYRRDSIVQTKAAAERQSRDVIAYWTTHGTIIPLLTAPVEAKVEAAEPVVVKTWSEAATRFETVVLPTKKPSTRHGYRALLKGEHFVAWQELPLTAITSGVIAEWDGLIAATDVGESTRRNHHVVLRSVLRCALAAGWISTLPELPSLPKVGRTVVVAVDPTDVHAILYETDEGAGDYFTAHRKAARLAFALMALAGLRSSEVRGLRWRDVDFVRGIITVRHAICAGEEDTPKSGNEREIPITPALAAFLSKPGNANEFVAVKPVRVRGEAPTWSDQGIYKALQRACARLGIAGQRAHALRHSFVTGLFDAGVGAHTVQSLAGHASLEVTQRYAHTNHEAKVAAVAHLTASMERMGNVIPMRKAKPAKRAAKTG